MSKKAIVDRVRDSFPSREAASAAVSAVAAAVVAELVAEGKAALPGVGVFHRKLRPERDGRNPATGERIKIAEREVVTFKSHVKL